MLRGLILVAGCLIFMFPHTIAVCAGEESGTSAKSIPVPDAHEGQLASGTYLVIGTFQKLSNARQFSQRHKEFDAALFPVTLKGKRVFRIVIGPIRKNKKNSILKSLRKAGIEGAWDMHVDSKKMSARKGGQNTDASPPEPDSLHEAGNYLVIGVFRDVSNARRLKLRHNKFTPKVIASGSKGKQNFRVVVGPVRKGKKSAILKSLRKAGIKVAWEMQVSPGKSGSAKHNLNVAVTKPEQTPFSEKNQGDDTPATKAPEPEQPAEIPPASPSPTLPLPSKESPAKAKITYRPGDTFSDCNVCPKMIVVPAGKFVMGEADGGMTGDAPATPVSLPKAIAVGQFEVTFEEWDACVSDGGCLSYKPHDDGWGRGKQPVMNISWFDTLGYLNWLYSKTGHFYRLPSEAEWEFAARAGSVTNYWWGDKTGTNQAVCKDCGNEGDYNRSAPVGSFSPNAFGLYDTAGNLWEWTQDCYSMTSYREHTAYPGPVSGPDDCSRVLRGGGWDIISTGLRSSFRLTSGPSNRNNIYGFRVVRDLH